MAPQSLDLGLSLGLGVAAFQPSSFCHPGNAVVVPAAAEREASPAAAEERERRCSPAGSPVSSGSGSGNKRGAAERSAGAGAGSGDEDDDGAARKKLRLSKDQAAVLEECFKTHHTLTPKQKVALASSLGLRPRQVEVWFQNRRARTKLKQTEVDCEYLKRWCEQLAEENRRLGKEVAELRALSAAPAAPLTTLTMCLSCRRVASSSPSSSSSPRPSIPGAAAASGGSMASPAAAATLPAHRQFFCGFRDAGAAAAAYGTASAGLAKPVRAAR
ncbi:Homeobox-leucine zipper protein HOX28 [Zea mays]|uniref:Homeobox-leucine zipper protein HOX28 n=1 Tax=Zea mays TaxID=4577 RepID=A0A3L6DFZ8_MAIZE|nr:Homeobox-leucine zipper protein HOX28 [Zea mays]